MSNISVNRVLRSSIHHPFGTKADQYNRLVLVVGLCSAMGSGYDSHRSHCDIYRAGCYSYWCCKSLSLGLSEVAGQCNLEQEVSRLWSRYAARAGEKPAVDQKRDSASVYPRAALKPALYTSDVTGGAD